MYLEVEGGGVFVQMFEGLEAGEQRGKRGGAGRVLEEIVEFTDLEGGEIFGVWECMGEIYDLGEMLEVIRILGFLNFLILFI